MVNYECKKCLYTTTLKNNFTKHCKTKRHCDNHDIEYEGKSAKVLLKEKEYNKKYNEINKEKRALVKSIYHQKCQAKMTDEERKIKNASQRIIQKEWRQKNWIKNKINKCRRYDKDNEFTWEKSEFITEEYMEKIIEECEGKCIYCFNLLDGLSIQWDTQLTFERLDNTKPHIEGNVKIACRTCNVEKGQIYRHTLHKVYECIPCGYKKTRHRGLYNRHCKSKRHIKKTKRIIRKDDSESDSESSE